MKNGGFNLIGYATSPMGLGEDLRSLASIFEILDVPFSVIDIPTEVQGQIKPNWNNLSTKIFNTNIFLMSPVECQKLNVQNPKIFKQAKVNIGYFLWELPDFPKDFISIVNKMDQVWCPTKFVQQSIFQATKKLTLAVPLPVIFYPPSIKNFRQFLKIKKKDFVVLYIFDARSTISRKNPEAVLRVFMTYLETNPDSILIIKVGRWNGILNLNFIPSHNRIRVISDNLSPTEVSSLYDASDCYLSLHRSEGFGRTLVEALQHGLYVISSNFSGPKDFLNEKNALLIDWEKVSTKPADYPNSDYSWWANPSEKDAVLKLTTAGALSKKSRNIQGTLDGNNFLPKNMAKNYKDFINFYLKDI